MQKLLQARLLDDIPPLLASRNRVHGQRILQLAQVIEHSCIVNMTTQDALGPGTLMGVLQSSLLAGHPSDILLIILQLFTVPLAINELPYKTPYLLCMTKLLYQHGKGRQHHSLICKAEFGFMRSAMTSNMGHVIHLIAQLQMPARRCHCMLFSTMSILVLRPLTQPQSVTQPVSSPCRQH